MIKRLFQWAFRVKCLPDMNEHGYTGEERPPTFWEAVTGISNT